MKSTKRKEHYWNNTRVLISTFTFIVLLLFCISFYKYEQSLTDKEAVSSETESVQEKTAASEVALVKKEILNPYPDFDKDGELFSKKIQPFLSEYCVRCHGPDKEKGSLRVDKLIADLNDHYSLSHFQNIIDELTTQNMPPEDEDQPKPEAVVEFTNLLSKYIDAAKMRYSSGGGRPVRRLTRTEFLNTVTDLLGVYTDTDALPNDLVGHKFETDASSLYVTDMHIQAYLTKGREIIKSFIASRNRKPGLYEVPVQFSPALTKSNLKVDATNVPPAGYLTVRTTWWQRDPQGKNKITISPSSSENEYDITGTKSSPQEIDLNFYKADRFLVWKIKRSNAPSIKMAKGLTKEENLARIKALGKYKLSKETLVKAQETMIKHPIILGDIRNYQKISHQPYEFFAPFLKNGDPGDSAAPLIIRKFVDLMKRGRSVDQAYVLKLTDVFQRGRKMGLPFWKALEEPLAVAMCSMDSMFHFEDRSPDTKNISGVELANRLSFALWRSAPDAELLKLGKSETLLDEQVKVNQVKRMMGDDKFNRFLSDFAAQWLELHRQDVIAVDRRLFKNVNDAVKLAMKEETIQFVSYLVRENLPLTNLIESDFMLLNNVISRHYGIPKVYGNEFRPVPREGNAKAKMRGGILTHAGILMQGGTGDRTSIVERGAFIARKIINKPPLPPPPNAGELPTSEVETAKMTGAELVKHHASSPQCANCHAKIDPLGMGLEEFDAVGMPRTEEKRLNPGLHLLSAKEQKNPKNLVIKVPIDTKGNLYDGQTFKGVSEMKHILLTKEHDLAKGYIKALITFINGREANFADDVVSEDIANLFSKKGYPARSIIEQVFLSRIMTAHK